ncbi:conserved hypothetical protein [Sphingomonas aurantiaca]|uniref:DUF4166 domain-containing protein n=1 Tax=Sphingomonas aurantiaca TaxID=185949 RepID=A0A5E8ACY4_9SPHN|nr:DUF4166 domain-containing protein [Sphingomonas aurantiaca]VVT29354.1 conserved hypothetical protein [Sphingomonas aurantiaca]
MTTLFRRMLGPAMDSLAPSLRTVHDSDDDQIWSGDARIWASGNPVARLLCRMMRLPAPGSGVPVTVRFERRGDTEHWHRRFGDRQYRSTLRIRHGRLVERMGPAASSFDVSAVDGALHMDLVGFRFLGIRLPRWARPACHAVEQEQGAAFMFDIPIDLPLFGRVIHYRGRLEKIDD